MWRRGGKEIGDRMGRKLQMKPKLGGEIKKHFLNWTVSMDSLTISYNHIKSFMIAYLTIWVAVIRP